MILTLLKRAWPMLRMFGRPAISRETYILAEDGTPLTSETGEVLTVE